MALLPRFRARSLFSCLLVLGAILIFAPELGHASGSGGACTSSGTAPSSTAPMDFQALSGGLTNLFNNANCVINTILGQTSQGASGNYYAFAKVLVAAGFLFTFLIEVFKWQFGGATMLSIVEVLTRGVIVTLLFSGYTSWTALMFNASNQIGQAAQQAALGDSSIMGPSAFIWKFVLEVQFSNVTIMLWNLMPFASIILNLFLAFLQVALGFVCFYVSVWPTCLYIVAKLAGPLFFPFLFSRDLSSFFDSWLRLFVHSCLFALVGKLVMVTACLVVTSILGYQYVANGGTGKAITLSASGIGDVAILFPVIVLLIFFIGSTDKFTSAMSGGGSMGIGSGLSRIAMIAARAAVF